MPTVTRTFTLHALALTTAAATAALATHWPAAAAPGLVDRAAAAGIAWSSTPSWDLSSVDYDRDGDTDFAMSLHMRHAGELRRNNADGTFDRVAFSADPATTIMPRPNELGGLVDRHACTWADFDRNGLPDAYCTAGRYASNRYKTESINNELWLQRSPGAFTDTATASGVGEPCTRGRHTTAIDVNADGWPDLFTGAQAERNDSTDPCNRDPLYPYIEQSKVHINRGLDSNGMWLGFRYGREWNVSHPNVGARLALPWDYNRDGRLDLLAATFAGKPAYLYRNTGTGFVEVARAGTVRLPTFNGATLSDLTGDGIADLVFADNTGFAYRAGTATGISGTTVRIGTIPSGGIGWTTAVGDIDGDEALDVYGQVASGTVANPTDYVYVRQPAGGWQPYPVPSAAGDANDVVAITVNGRAQFVVLNGGNNEGEEPGPVQLIAWE